MLNRELPTRTRAPIQHKERAEFLSDGWIDAARAYLEPRVAESRDSLKGHTFRMCELYHDAPPHLNRPDNDAAFHVILDDGELTVGVGTIDDCNFRVECDYNKGYWVSATVYENHPERQERIQKETYKLFGDVFKVDMQGKTAKPIMKILAGMHDYLAKRTAGNSDIAHKVETLGLQKHIDELENQGYTVIENAFSNRMADALSEDLARLIKETQEQVNPKRYVASMLLARGHLWQDIAIHPVVHTLAQHTLGADCNLGQSLGFTKTTGMDTHRLHNDPPHPLTGDVCCNVTTIWALEDFTETSGATLVVPGSHKQNCPPPANAHEQAIKVLMPRGSVAMWHGSLWHGSAIREDAGTRMTIHNTYLRNWVRTFDNYLEIDPAVLENNSPAISTLCGVDDLYGKNDFAGPDYQRMQ